MPSRAVPPDTGVGWAVAVAATIALAATVALVRDFVTVGMGPEVEAKPLWVAIVGVLFARGVEGTA